MRHALTAGKPRLFPFRQTVRQHVATARGAWLAGLMALIATGCTTVGQAIGPERRDNSASAISASASEVNWAFADVTAMEQKVASLQSENARLVKRVMELEAALDTVIEAPKETVIAASDQPGADGPPARDRPAPSAPPLRQPEAVIASPGGRVEDVPVAEAPRLVQPSFAAAETVFENEAPLTDRGDIAVSSVLWGVHLASYRAQEEARNGWRKLQQENPDELGLLEPRVESIDIDGRGRFWRLIGGGFETEATAQTLCQTLEAKGLYCQVAGFGGQRLTLGQTAG